MRGRGGRGGSGGRRERAGRDALCAMARDEDEVGLTVQFAGEGLEGAVEGDFAHGWWCLRKKHG